MTAGTAVGFVLGLAYIPMTAWFWFGFFRQFWPSVWRAMLRGEQEVTAWAAFCWQFGLGAMAGALAAGRPAAAAGLAVMVAVMFIVWLWRRRRGDRAARSDGAKARARLATMLARLRKAGASVPDGRPA